MKKYNDYRKEEKTEKKVQVTKAYCDNEEDIEAAIEKSKRELKDSKVPYGYKKYNEKIITTVYKMPSDKCINLNSNKKIKDEKYINKIIEDKKIYNDYKSDYYNKSKYTPKYDDNAYDYKNKTSNYKSLKNYDQSDLTIYNYDTITKNHDYLESSSKSPNRTNAYKIQFNNDINEKKKSYNTEKKSNYDYKNNIQSINRTEIQKTDVNVNRYINRNLNRNINRNQKNYYNQTEYKNKYDTTRKYANYTPIHEGRIENYFENEISQDGKFLVSMTLCKKITDEDESKKIREDYNYNNYNYKYGDDYYENNYKNQNEEIEIEENENYGIENDYEENRRGFRTIRKDIGDNYKYYERNENRSPDRRTETFQRRRQPYHVYREEICETDENYKESNYEPIRQGKKITRYYGKDNYIESNYRPIIKEKKVIRYYDNENNYGDYDDNHGKNDNYNEEYNHYEEEYENHEENEY